ncbi:GAF domain-containing protein [Gelidibacter pelagius]|uniref:GAF domain-containing protein n=1 Tax=Gelidibacter pelagius TaxID=2819985 RepID=A0ABS3SSR0_9FLAO|nr:GAF domain-containing protein [Gelidibacter pelagius]MBO3098704.1 GAF domain-containing protein [Gelidibacter pelagius]
MKDINDQLDSPLALKISFDKLLERYETMAQSDDSFKVEKAERVLQAGNSVSELRDGFSDPTLLETYQKEIQIILEDSFSEVLTLNEIKTASMPLHDLNFNASSRFKSIVENAGPDFRLKISNMPEDDHYRVACTIILYFYYGYQMSFRRSLFYEIPDAKGIIRTYKILFNADFAEVVKTASAPEITEEDYRLLLGNFEDIDLWREKFPPHSYIYKGFTINNIFDVTDDRSISDIKSTLLISGKRKNDNFIDDFQVTFESLFNIKNLKVGFVIYNKESQTFERVEGKFIESYLLTDTAIVPCQSALCGDSYKSLITEKEYFSILDVEQCYHQSHEPFYKNLYDQNIKSAIFAPISSEGELLGVLEIVSHKVGELNSVNANLLRDVMPFIVSSLLRSKEEEKHLIEAVIQQECTSIHPSVSWRFEDAARVFLDKKRTDGKNVAFEEITFENVYPLFGQIDVMGSSETRNEATRQDLSLQLSLSKEIIEAQLKKERLPIYEQLLHQLEVFFNSLDHHFIVDSEQEIGSFFENEIHPLFEFIEQKNNALRMHIENYFAKIDRSLNLIYYHQKNYDDTITMINKNMTHILDHKQEEAQQMYPHYFERYKTDGVEHNMYIGESITKEHGFHKIYLYNLRLWQLQVMCEMENEFYRNKPDYPSSVDVASMVLVFNKPLTIQFRMDEKQFDVYGTYNASYEVVKKRVDKALIKGTDERVTVNGKLTIIYSQKEDEEAYLKYIKFLQFKKVFDMDIELLDLEDLQGIAGLKAIRVPILYNHPKGDHYYTYDDLINEIQS